MAHTIALISLFSGKAVPPTMAMTVSLADARGGSMSLKQNRVKFPFGVVLLLSEESRKSSLELFEPV